MADPRTDGDLFTAEVVTRKTVDEAPAAFLSDPPAAAFAIAPGAPVELTATVKAGRHTAAIPAAPTAMSGSRRAAGDTAILPAHPVRR